MRLTANWRMLPAPVRKLIVLVIGGTVVAVGIVMFVTPGPSMLVIPAGLAILSIEFVWARRLLARYKAAASKVGESLRRTTRIFGQRTGVPPASEATRRQHARPGTVPCSVRPSGPPGDQTRRPAA
jgi:hypothetical protein